MRSKVAMLAFSAADTKVDCFTNASSSNEGDACISEECDSNDVTTHKIHQQVERPTTSNAAKSVRLASDKVDPLILRKGDLVRLSNE